MTQTSGLSVAVAILGSPPGKVGAGVGGRAMIERAVLISIGFLGRPAPGLAPPLGMTLLPFLGQTHILNI